MELERRGLEQTLSIYVLGARAVAVLTHSGGFSLRHSLSHVADLQPLRQVQ